MECDSDESVLDDEEQPSREFSDAQIASLSAFYTSGMKVVGKQYAGLLHSAATETGLSTEQVKVSAHRAVNYKCCKTSDYMGVGSNFEVGGPSKLHPLSHP